MSLLLYINVNIVDIITLSQIVGKINIYKKKGDSYGKK